MAKAAWQAIETVRDQLSEQLHIQINYIYVF
jgi:hypothetical protein